MNVQTSIDRRYRIASTDGHGMAATAIQPQAAQDNRAVVATYIANDVIRHGIEAVLRQLPAVGAVHHCARPQDVLSAIVDEHFDVLITTDPELAAAGCEPPGRTRILMLVDDSDAEDIALEMPTADGFLLKHELTGEQLSHALAQVGRGEIVMPSSLARRLLARRAATGTLQPAGRARLTDRQLSALRLMADGLSNKQIARRLQISEHGAKRLVTSIMLKLDAPNRTTAVLAAMRFGVIPPPGDEVAS
ncbi:MAG TPA: DNA-binding response regulator [Micromonosporaceae bacterium]|nr:DNA-binding response regulator [Micromonosporaceae bacterium]